MNYCFNGTAILMPSVLFKNLDLNLSELESVMLPSGSSL